MNLELLNNPVTIWFIIGLVFVLSELFIPGLVIIFFGAGAWTVAFALLFKKFGLNWQLIIFVLSSVFYLLAMRRFFSKMFYGKSNNAEDDADNDFIGYEAKAETTISPKKTGKVVFKGTQWEAHSEETIAPGEQVIITDKVSIKLIIRKK